MAEQAAKPPHPFRNGRGSRIRDFQPAAPILADRTRSACNLPTQRYYWVLAVLFKASSINSVVIGVALLFRCGEGADGRSKIHFLVGKNARRQNG